MYLKGNNLHPDLVLNSFGRHLLVELLHCDCAIRSTMLIISHGICRFYIGSFIDTEYVIVLGHTTISVTLRAYCVPTTKSCAVSAFAYVLKLDQEKQDLNYTGYLARKVFVG